MPIIKYEAVLSAASITPPVLPKIVPAPLPSLKKLSNSLFSISSYFIFSFLTILFNSFTVITKSVPHTSSLLISNFFAVQGVIATVKISSFDMLFYLVKYSFTTGPIIPIGLLQVDIFSNNSG